jgi:hypothetical protein
MDQITILKRFSQRPTRNEARWGYEMAYEEEAAPAGRVLAGVQKDAWNTVSFSPVETAALRLEVRLSPDVSGGILE